jgi:hypothetical protein
VHHQRNVEDDKKMVSVPEELEIRSADLINGGGHHQYQRQCDCESSDARPCGKRNILGRFFLANDSGCKISQLGVDAIGFNQRVDVVKVCQNVNRDKEADGVSTPFVEQYVLVEESS